MSIDLASAARQELERHREDLLYADRQKMKRGEFEDVARGLERRARWRLAIYAGVAALAVLEGLFTGRGSVLFLTMAFTSYVDYSHVKRTAATIRRLVEIDSGTTGSPAPKA